MLTGKERLKDSRCGMVKRGRKRVGSHSVGQLQVDGLALNRRRTSFFRTETKIGKER